MPKTFRFTAHAIHKYLERIRPNASETKAMRDLAEATDRAVLLFAPSGLGDPVYSVAAPPMLWIAKHEGDEVVIVTVINDPTQRREAERLIEEDGNALRAAQQVTDPATAARLASRSAPKAIPSTAQQRHRWAHVAVAEAAAYREQTKLATAVLNTALAGLRSPKRSFAAVFRETEAASGW